MKDIRFFYPKDFSKLYFELYKVFKLDKFWNWNLTALLKNLSWTGWEKIDFDILETTTLLRAASFLQREIKRRELSLMRAYISLAKLLNFFNLKIWKFWNCLSLYLNFIFSRVSFKMKENSFSHAKFIINEHNFFPLSMNSRKAFFAYIGLESQLCNTLSPTIFLFCKELKILT